MEWKNDTVWRIQYAAFLRRQKECRKCDISEERKKNHRVDSKTN